MATLKSIMTAVLSLEHLVYDQIRVTSPLRTATYSDEDLAPYHGIIALLSCNSNL